MAKKAAKKTAKKTAKKAAKTTAKRATAAAAPAPAAKAGKITTNKGAKPRPKTEVYNVISEHVGISRKDVAGVFEVLGELIAADLKKGGVGVFTVPGMMKVMVQRKPATKATTRKDPFNPGQMMTVKAKPARNIVKVRPLKALKDRVA